MSTFSTVITLIICGILFITIGYALVQGIWSAAMKITVPIQITLFVVLVVCVGRLFFNKENAQKLYKGIEQTGISQGMESTMRSALNMKPAEKSRSAAPSASVETVSESDTVKVAERVATPPPKKEVQDPVVEEKKVAQQPAVAPEPVKEPDYSHLDKGKVVYTYALPFDAKITVGFKKNAYRVISESLGKLDASEKKEVGQLIRTSLGKYVGKTIEEWDKSKISLESRYDEEDDRTRVFAIIPPDALD